MAFDGIIIALDIASRTGVAEGRPGQVPRLYSVDLKKTDDEFEDTFGRAVGWIADRLYAEKQAVEERNLRIVIEAPINTGNGGGTNANSLIITKGLWASISGFARARRIMVQRAHVATVRKHFIGVGNLPGDIAKREAKRVCEAFGWSPPNLDAADAGAIWHWAAHKWNPEATPKVTPDLFYQRPAA
jgi:hypothetical protein